MFLEKSKSKPATKILTTSIQCSMTMNESKYFFINTNINIKIFSL